MMGYKTVQIKGGTYLGSPTDIDTIGVKPVILTTTDVSDAQVKKLAKIVFQNIEQIKALNKVFGKINQEDMITDLQVAPLHTGMKDYSQVNSVQER